MEEERRCVEGVVRERPYPAWQRLCGSSLLLNYVVPFSNWFGAWGRINGLV